MPQRAFFACGSKERAVFFVRFGGFAAKTNKISGSFRPAEACPERRRRGDSGLFAMRPRKSCLLKSVSRNANSRRCTLCIAGCLRCGQKSEFIG
jgi:hypothetical protein